jgi:hypothetical protein
VRLHQTVPVTKHVQAIRDVADGVIRDDGAEGGVRERQRLTGVHTLELHARRDASQGCEPLAIANAALVDVHSGHMAARFDRQIDCRSARTAADLEHAAVGPHTELLRKPTPLRHGHPTALPDVLAIRCLPDCGLRGAREVAVNVVIEIDV